MDLVVALVTYNSEAVLGVRFTLPGDHGSVRVELSARVPAISWDRPRRHLARRRSFRHPLRRTLKPASVWASVGMAGGRGWDAVPTVWAMTPAGIVAGTLAVATPAFSQTYTG